MTAAHVVAGTSKIEIDTKKGRLAASIVVCDPEHDVAVLEVAGLGGAVIDFDLATGGDPAAVVGFPHDGPLTLSPARVRDRQEWQSSDIWGDGRYVHDAYAVRGDIRSGNSGGPLVSEEGRVFGVVVASSRADADTGYVLTADQVADALATGSSGKAGTADRC